MNFTCTDTIAHSGLTNKAASAKAQLRTRCMTASSKRGSPHRSQRRQIMGQRLFASGLRDIRFFLDCSQLQFSNMTGIPRAVISRIENGQACSEQRAVRIFEKIVNIDGLRHIEFSSVFSSKNPSLVFPASDLKFKISSLNKIAIDKNPVSSAGPVSVEETIATLKRASTLIIETSDQLNISRSFRIVLRHYSDSINTSPINIFYLDMIYASVRKFLVAERDALDDINIVLVGRFLQYHVLLRKMFPDYLVYQEDLRKTQIDKYLTSDEVADLKETLEEGARNNILEDDVPVAITNTRISKLDVPDSREIDNRSEYNLRTRILALFKLMKETDPAKIGNRLQGWSKLSEQLQEKIQIILSTMGW